MTQSNNNLVYFDEATPVKREWYDRQWDDFYSSSSFVSRYEKVLRPEQVYTTGIEGTAV